MGGSTKHITSQEELFLKVLERFQSPLLKVEEKITQSLETEISLLSEVGNYVFTGNGKRIRPLLHLLTASTCDRITEDNITVASVAEFIHTATLLHDDVIDDSHVRRGQCTVNDKWGNELSVMVGDFYYTLSMNALIEIGNIEVLCSFSKATQQMSEGEILQHAYIADTSMTPEIYLDIVRRKTAVLFGACCKSAALLADCAESDCEAWETFGLNLGIAFQLIDDLLDYAGDNSVTGKKGYTDLEENKVTWPIIHVLQNSNGPDRQAIVNMFSRAVKKEEDINRLKQAIADTHAVEATVDISQKYAKAAIRGLSRYRNRKTWSLIEDIARFITHRLR